MSDDRPLRPPALKCRTCLAPIRWIKTENDRPMPLNAEPVKVAVPMFGPYWPEVPVRAIVV